MRKCKLKDLIEVSRGATLPGRFYSTEGDLIRLTLGNFDYNNGGFKQNTSKEDIYYTGNVRPEFILNEGDIITPLTEQAIGLLGTTAKIPESGKYIQSQDVALVKCLEGLYPGYCYYLLPSNTVKKQLSVGAQQTSIRHTSPDKIKDCWVYILEIDEQKKVADFLDMFERKIAINRRITEKLEGMAKLLYDYWFVQFEFPNKEGKPYKSSGGKMVWNEKLKREIPEGWEYGTLSDIANITMGQSPKGCSYNMQGAGTIFYQGSTDFGDKFPQIRQYTTAPTRFAKKCDILMSVRAPVGDLNIANNNCSIGRGLAALNPKIGSISFLYYVLLSFKKIFDRRSVAGTTFGSISKDELFVLPVIVPNKSVIKKYEHLCKPILDAQMCMSEEIKSLTNQRDFLLPMLMNGQVEIKEK